MRVKSLGETPEADMPGYDQIYVEAWKATLEECEKKLEPSDYERALEIKTLERFRIELDKLQEEYHQDAPKYVIMLLYPTLDHYEQFTQTFVNMMSRSVETSMLWGLFYLVVKLSLESKGTIMRITKMLEKIGHALRRLNGSSASLQDFAAIKGDAVEVNREILILWVNIITLFRNQIFDPGPEFQTTLQSLSKMYADAMQNIGDAVKRIEKAAELAERQSRMVDLQQFQRVLSLSSNAQGTIKLPCHMLPVAKNKSFFGRADELRRIEEILHPANTTDGLASLAIYGLGGVGKTQTALAYAYSKIDELDAVFWISAENKLALQQSFSKIAVQGLEMPEAKPQLHLENMVLVMNWLQQTNAKWLLIFDNVESHEIFNDCWPASKHGALLVTTRRHIVASQPIEHGFEIEEFSIDEGSKFLVQQFPKRQLKTEDFQYASTISEKLNGLALAISQMAAYMNSRTMSFAAFLNLYDKYPKKLHRERKAGWKYLGYTEGLDTVWDISFGALSKPAAACLGILCFWMPDAIPFHFLEPPSNLKLKNGFDFCQDELGRWDVIEQLTDHALVKHDQTENSLSLHRLVQSEFLFRMNKEDRQDSFNAAVQLMLAVFSDRLNFIFRDALWERLNSHWPHIGAITTAWNDSQDTDEPLKPTTDFFNLLKNAAFVVYDNDRGGIASRLTDTAEKAYRNLPDSDKDPLIWIQILTMLCMNHLVQGDFEAAENASAENLRIREELELGENVEMAYTYSQLAVSCDSQLRYSEARLWHEKAASIYRATGEDRLLYRNFLNRGRNAYGAGYFVESEELLNEALKRAVGFDEWFFLTFTHQTLASLYSRNGDLDRAHMHVSLARKQISRSEGLGNTSWLSALVSYRASWIAIQQERIQDAVDEAERCVAIGKLNRVPLGMQARFVHVLSVSLSRDPKHVVKSEDARKEAQRLRGQLPKARSDLNDESDLAYERLVPMFQR